MRVLMLATGGTIAFSEGPQNGRSLSGAELLASLETALPTSGYGMLPSTVVEDLAAQPSWDLGPQVMVALAQRAKAAILDEGFNGVVITHGTDTLEETAFLTDLLAGEAIDRGVIVVTGAMRVFSELSADGPRNLASALRAAVDPALRGAGVVVCLNDELHAARWITKVDAVGVAAFSSAPFPLLGQVAEGTVERLGMPPSRPPVAVGDPQSAALIKTYPGIDAMLLHAAVQTGARGVVLEGTGNANVPSSLLGAIEELTAQDVPVVIASRCRTRAVSLEQMGGGAAAAAQAGAIGARGLSATKTRSALMVALGTGGVHAVAEWFSKL